MRRKFNDDEQQEDNGSGGYMDSSNYNDDFDDEDEEDENHMDVQDMADYARIDLMEIDLNQRLLESALEISKDSFIWYFMSVESKLKRIKKIYDKLMELVQSEVRDNE